MILNTAFKPSIRDTKPFPAAHIRDIPEIRIIVKLASVYASCICFVAVGTNAEGTTSLTKLRISSSVRGVYFTISIRRIRQGIKLIIIKRADSAANALILSCLIFVLIAAIDAKNFI